MLNPTISSSQGAGFWRRTWREGRWAASGGRRLRLLVVIVLTSASLAGCGAGDADRGASTATATTQPTSLSTTPSPPSDGATPVASDGMAISSPAAPRIQVGSVVWATAVDPVTKAPMEPVDAFPDTATTLYAVIPIRQMTPGVVLTAQWSYNGTPLTALTSAVVAERAEVETWVEFHLERVDDLPWPAGDYQIAVLVDGRPARTAQVEVRRTTTG